MGDRDEYWMHAQLKHLSVLKTTYGRLDLRDMDFILDVGIHQTLKTRIPTQIIRELEVIRDLISETDRGRKFKLAFKHLQMRRRRQIRDVQNTLADLQKIFLPTTFSTFIEVERPFRYSDSVRGSDFYDIPFQTFPKTMKVISRTDLSLSTPAADGKLIFKRKELGDEISKIFGSSP